MHAVAGRVKQRRLERNLTQKAFSLRVGLALPTYRRFEKTGEISLKGLVQIAVALDATDDFGALFAATTYENMDDLLAKTHAKPRKKGMKNE